uniref:Uncharacterized protein n=1 Tax=Macaca fascicularis TaxID=9541 RepID=A0A7N9DDU8_MACFA
MRFKVVGEVKKKGGGGLAIALSNCIARRKPIPPPPRGARNKKQLLLDYGNYVRQKTKCKQFSYSSSKWAVKQQRQLATSRMHLAQELLANIQCSGGSRSFAKDGQVWQLTPAIPALWEAKASRSLEVRSLRPARPT